jgi:hypothetical protein
MEELQIRREAMLEWSKMAVERAQSGSRTSTASVTPEAVWSAMTSLAAAGGGGVRWRDDHPDWDSDMRALSRGAG